MIGRAEYNIDTWYGEGWYSVKWSDGGQDYTNDGPVWVETYYQLGDLAAGAEECSGEDHLPYVEYHGSFGKPVDMDNLHPYERHELEAFLGEFEGEYDLDLIELYATECDNRGRRYWIVDEDELAEIVETCEVGTASTESILERLEQMRRAYVI